MLREIPTFEDPNLLVGLDVADDAAVYRLETATTIVQTVDFFTPVVDDPRDYGAIAAANALSDVYAMGGRPLLALNIVAWPVDALGTELLAEVLAGGAEKVREAGALLAGGHSVVDQEPKYGLAVTGLVSAGEPWTLSGARPGDRLILTKPIGSGIAATAIKRGVAEPGLVREATRVMAALNRPGATAGRKTGGVHACTDVTGYGLLGHLWKLCDVSGVSAVVEEGAIPEIAGTRDLAARGVVPGGSRANLKAIAPHCRFAPHLPDHRRQWLADAQTSGGLLLAVDPEKVPPLLSALAREGALTACEVGCLGDGPPAIEVR